MVSEKSISDSKLEEKENEVEDTKAVAKKLTIAAGVQEMAMKSA